MRKNIVLAVTLFVATQLAVCSKLRSCNRLYVGTAEPAHVMGFCQSSTVVNYDKAKDARLLWRALQANVCWGYLCRNFERGKIRFEIFL